MSDLTNHSLLNLFVFIHYSLIFYLTLSCFNPSVLTLFHVSILLEFKFNPITLKSQKQCILCQFSSILNVTQSRFNPLSSNYKKLKQSCFFAVLIRSRRVYYKNILISSRSLLNFLHHSHGSCIVFRLSKHHPHHIC